jgi:hypothetical protein
MHYIDPQQPPLPRHQQHRKEQLKCGDYDCCQCHKLEMWSDLHSPFRLVVGVHPQIQGNVSAWIAQKFPKNPKLAEAPNF